MNQNGELEIDLYEIFRILKKRWIILLSAFLLGSGGVVCGILINYQPVYQATAMLYIMPQNEEKEITMSGVQIGTLLVSDIETIVQNPAVSMRVVEKLNLIMDEEQLVEKIEVTNPTDTRLLNIIAEDSDPILSRDLANTFAEETVNYINAVMNIDLVTVIHQASLPNKAESMNLVKMGAIGGVILLILAGIAIIMNEMLNGKIKTENDVKKYLGLDVIGRFPGARDKKNALAAIKDRILLLGKDVHTILFTSSSSKDGGIGVICRVADQLANSGKKVLLIDCNLRSNELAELNRYPYSPNEDLAFYLSTEQSKIPVVAQKNSWDMIFAGGKSGQPLELLLSEKFRKLMVQLKEDQNYDYILVHSAPLEKSLDATLAAEYCDRIFYIIKLRKSKAATVQTMVAQLEKFKDRITGVITV